MRLLVWSVAALALLSCGAEPTRQPSVIATGAVDACGTLASAADADGRLVGATRDSTKIRVAVPPSIRPGTEVRLDWHMTSGPGTAPLVMYAERADLGTSTARVDPRSVDPNGSENDYAVYITLPEAGCWRMHGERGGGKLSGDIWVSVRGG